ncbi:MAG: ABC-type metal ion transporter, periplasmic subunit [Ignavibacteria bacterium]|nr:ABC-type metal ion transporter, periplasmic subunit [Ignavibacteria bacterium]
MIRKKLVLLVAIALFTSCNAQNGKPTIVVTNQPLAGIIKELIGTRCEIVQLLPPGASPHTYSPKASDVIEAQACRALFYVSEELDGWASKLQTPKKIKVIDFLLDSNKLTYSEGVVDPHFWTDPITVKGMLPKLVESLSEVLPDFKSSITANATIFERRLDLLDKQVLQLVDNLKGKSVFLFHPSFNYFLKRYGMFYAGSLEPSPGKEPSPNYMIELTEKIKLSGTKAIFSEPQLPAAPAKALAEAANVLLYILDPLGGTKGLYTYSDIILYNARIFKKALE